MHSTGYCQARRRKRACSFPPMENQNKQDALSIVVILFCYRGIAFPAASTRLIPKSPLPISTSITVFDTPSTAASSLPPVHHIIQMTRQPIDASASPPCYRVLSMRDNAADVQQRRVCDGCVHSCGPIHCNCPGDVQTRKRCRCALL